MEFLNALSFNNKNQFTPIIVSMGGGNVTDVEYLKYLSH